MSKIGETGNWNVKPTKRKFVKEVRWIGEIECQRSVNAKNPVEKYLLG